MAFTFGSAAALGTEAPRQKVPFSFGGPPSAEYIAACVNTDSDSDCSSDNDANASLENARREFASLQNASSLSENSQQSTTSSLPAAKNNEQKEENVQRSLLIDALSSFFLQEANPSLPAAERAASAVVYLENYKCLNFS